MNKQYLIRIEEEQHRGQLRNVVQFLTDDDATLDRDYNNSMIYCNLFGIGPAWTLYVSFQSGIHLNRWLMGFIIPVCWIMGAIYLGSASTIRRRAGLASLISVAIFVAYVVLLTFLLSVNSFLAIICVGVYWMVAMFSVTFLACAARSRMEERNEQRNYLKRYITSSKCSVFYYTHRHSIQKWI